MPGSPRGLPAAPGSRRFILATVFLAVLLGVRAFFLEFYLVASGSMEETLVDGDLVLVDKAGYGPWTLLPGGGPAPARPGDLVLYRITRAEPEVRVKRVVGVPGDTLEMRKSILYRNGRALDEPDARRSPWPADLPLPPMRWHRRHMIGEESAVAASPRPDDWGPIALPADRYFVLGDHRARSVDSRHHGPVRAADLIGRPFLVAYSYGRRTAKPFPWLQAVRTARIGPVE